MKRLKLLFLNLIVVLFIYNCSKESSEIGGTNEVLDSLKYYEELNISYGNDANQTFDLYLPAKRTTNTKTMILIHGGGWSSGDKSDMNVIKDLIRLDLPNLAIANINYRLANQSEKPYPMQIEDITSIINFFK
jgi:acetyl esterase/lipase